MKVKLLVRKSDLFPLFFSQYVPLPRKTHTDYHDYKVWFSDYTTDNKYPDSMFSIENIPEYYSWDNRFMRILTSGTTAPDWKLPSVNRNRDTIKLSELRGKYVLLDFWFIGCGACIESIPTLNSLQKKYGNIGLKVIGINCYNDHKGKIEQYCKDRDMKYPNVWKGDEIVDKYKITGAPIFYFINKDGEIVYSQIGHNSDKLTNAVKKFVKR